MFELMENSNSSVQPAVIKVIGVGGGGGNAVTYMMNMEIQGVELFCANTDLQALETSPVKNKLQLGKEITRGLGAGANPEIGRKSALEDREKVISMLEGTDMLFIAAGMGGGTGTGAAPVIAEIAKQLGILTVAVVTKPFTFEGQKRNSTALEGIKELSEHVDSLITVPNDRLLAVMGKSANISQAFDTANSVLFGAVQGISDLILKPGLINVDFADVRTVMTAKGIAMMGAGSAFGENRAQEAAEKAISSPLLENIDLSSTKGILVNITAGPDFLLDEFSIIGSIIQDTVAYDATAVIGNVIDPNLEEEIRVTIVATGIDLIEQNNPQNIIEEIQKIKKVAEPTPKVTQKNTGENENKKSGYLDLDIPAFLKKKVD